MNLMVPHKYIGILSTDHRFRENHGVSEREGEKNGVVRKLLLRINPEQGTRIGVGSFRIQDGPRAITSCDDQHGRRELPTYTSRSRLVPVACRSRSPPHP